MRIDRRFKPEVAVSKRPAVPVLHHCRLDAEAGVIEATDGFLAVRVPAIIEEGDTTGVVPADALKLARTIGDKDDAVRLNCNGAVEVPGVASFERHTQQGFPNIPTAFDGLPQKAKITVGINAAILHQAAKALGTDQVRVEVFSQRHGIRVTPLHGLGGEAIVMPVKIGLDG